MDPKKPRGVRDGNEITYVRDIGKAAQEGVVNVRSEQLLVEKVKALPPECRAEVEDFVDFLQARVADQRLADAVTSLSKPVLKAVWDNDLDAEYDRL